MKKDAHMYTHPHIQFRKYGVNIIKISYIQCINHDVARKKERKKEKTS